MLTRFKLYIIDCTLPLSENLKHIGIGWQDVSFHANDPANHQSSEKSRIQVTFKDPFYLISLLFIHFLIVGVLSRRHSIEAGGYSSPMAFFQLHRA